MTRRMKITNVVLAVALVASVVAGVLVVRKPAAQAATTDQTATVSTGTVVSSVTASGNIAASSQVGVSFTGDGGTVTAIYVRVGDHVRVHVHLA